MGSSSWAARVADGVIRTTTPRKLIGTGNNLMCCSATLLAVAGFLRFHVSIFGKADGPDRTAAASPAEREELWAEEERRAGATGSRLPDCAHACGPCSPCRRVMVSFRCAQEASESCPVAYRCMCRGRFFRVPSL
ncbi:hypothetical protein PVAP13_7NG180200 [Panicum virgatum]|uniref:Epidermal patterning factor-like protein n=1 Tax=Panicum virgatum TaxID=38727 RepID=A0A8T0PVX6_PANVG|nr:hypothetical protein PVAP13_7NG180200 [Panicum virgatum]